MLHRAEKTQQRSNFRFNACIVTEGIHVLRSLASLLGTGRRTKMHSLEQEIWKPWPGPSSLGFSPLPSPCYFLHQIPRYQALPGCTPWNKRVELLISWLMLSHIPLRKSCEDQRDCLQFKGLLHVHQLYHLQDHKKYKVDLHVIYINGSLFLGELRSGSLDVGKWNIHF